MCFHDQSFPSFLYLLRILRLASYNFQLTWRRTHQKIDIFRYDLARNQPIRSSFVARHPIPDFSYLLLHFQPSIAVHCTDQPSHDASIGVGISLLGNDPLYALLKGLRTDHEVDGVTQSHPHPPWCFVYRRILLNHLSIFEGFLDAVDPNGKLFVCCSDFLLCKVEGFQSFAFLVGVVEQIVNAKGVESIGEDDQYVRMDEDCKLANSLDNILEGKIMAPDWDSYQGHKSAITLWGLWAFLCSLAAEVGLMHFHVAGFGHWVADSIANIDRLREIPVAHFLSYKI